MPQTLFYKPGKAPNAQEREAKEIVLFLERELNAVSQAFTESSYVKFQELHVEPERPRDGMVVYADGADWDPGYGEGHYGRVANAWVPANAAAAIAAIPAPAAFSVHKNGTDQTGIADVTYTTVTWPTEVYDVGGYFASNGWTPPAGKVTMTVCLWLQGTSSASGLAAMEIVKNGSTFRRSYNAPYTSGGFVGTTIDDIANGTDVYTVKAYLDVSAGTVTVNGLASSTYFMGHWISA